ncbi:MAG: GTP 3',8-cyclase MoaA [Pseudomonadales bacterium]
MTAQPDRLIDGFGRVIDYVRLSVTDRCDFRCVYCMAEDMEFVPRQQVLTLEEMALISRAFIGLGVKRIRLTGGEPLIRNNVQWLVEQLGQEKDLDELLLTTNGSQLPRLAENLYQAGLGRINISLDSLQPERFKRLTRTGKLTTVLKGIDSARAAGFKRIKINSVILKGRNEDEVLDLVEFCRAKELDISFIEEMPLGHIVEHDRALSFISSEDIRDTIDSRYPLTPSSDKTGGPSRYHRMQDSNIRIGFISPHSNNFCGDCNRVRVTAEGRLILCLGNEDSLDLRAITRNQPGEIAPLQSAIVSALTHKPERHHFDLHDEPSIVRFMNMTGG